jgi:hypothetical protein
LAKSISYRKNRIKTNYFVSKKRPISKGILVFSGTAWWFPTPVINGTSIDFPPPGGAPGPAGLTHLPNGLIGYIGTFTKNGFPLPTDVNLWNGFILVNK